VQSEFEKDLYCSWGWDKEHVKVSGIPRYDAIEKLKSTAEDRRSSFGKMKILFVGSTMAEYNPTQVSYLGIRQYWVGNNIRVYLKDIIDAIKTYDDVELVIRPHDIGDEKLWLDFIKKNKNENKITLVSAKPDFLNLVSKCDCMILGYWSTAVREGIMFDIPTVIMDYSKIDDAFPFAKANLCQTAKTPRDVKQIIDKIYTDFKRNAIVKEKLYNNENYNFYLGINDGRNTERVAQEIIRQTDS
jgi:UDP-N-acetylglucosamine 2-epimerase